MSAALSHGVILNSFQDPSCTSEPLPDRQRCPSIRRFDKLSGYSGRTGCCGASAS